MKTCRFVPSQKIGAFTLYRFYVFSTWWRLVPNMDSLPSEPGGSFDCPIETNRNRPGKKIHVFSRLHLGCGPPFQQQWPEPEWVPASGPLGGGPHPSFFCFIQDFRISRFPREFPPSSSNKKSWTWHKDMRSLTVTIIWHTVDGSETLHQLIGTLSPYSIISKVLYIPSGCLGFLPSTLSNLQKRTRKTWFQTYKEGDDFCLEFSFK